MLISVSNFNISPVATVKLTGLWFTRSILSHILGQTIQLCIIQPSSINNSLNQLKKLAINAPGIISLGSQIILKCEDAVHLDQWSSGLPSLYLIFIIINIYY